MILKGKDKEKERQKELQKERKKRGNRKYGQAKLKPSKKGMISCVIAGIIAVVLLTLIAITYVYKGKAAGYIGGLGVSAFIFSCSGIGMAVRGFRERDKDYRTCKIGLGFNILFSVSLLLFFIGGFL